MPDFCTVNSPSRRHFVLLREPVGLSAHCLHGQPQLSTSPDSSFSYSHCLCSLALGILSVVIIVFVLFFWDKDFYNPSCPWTLSLSVSVLGLKCVVKTMSVFVSMRPFLVVCGISLINFFLLEFFLNLNYWKKLWQGCLWPSNNNLQVCLHKESSLYILYVKDKDQNSSLDWSMWGLQDLDIHVL